MKVSKYNIIKEIDNKVLVYNSFSKASIFLEKVSETTPFENIDEYKKLDDTTKKILYENGFIIDDNRDEFKELKYTFEQNFFDTNHFNLILVPSLLCNFSCPYCCEKDYTCGEENVKIYFKTLKKYGEKNFNKHNIVQISLFGGEPLIYAQECIEFLDWVKKDSIKHGYEYFSNIVTNGSLLTEEIFESLAKHNLYSLQITIDSDKNNHDQMRIFKSGKKSFDLLMDKSNYVAKEATKYKNFKFVLRINLNNTNLEKVKDALEYIKPEYRKNVYLLIRAIYNTHAYNETNCNDVSNLKEYFDLGEELGFNVLKEKYNYQTCEACGDRKVFYLMPDLSLWKCINDIGYDKPKVGQMTSTGDIILYPDNIINWYNHCTSAFRDEECINCKYLPDCLGGCPLYKCKYGEKSCRPFDMISLPFIY